MFKCRYSSIVGVDNSNSDDFLPEVSHDEIVAKGSFIDSFRLDIFQNDKFRRPIGSDRILLGHMVYGQITWGISSLYNKLSFYVDQCTVTISDSTLKRQKKITMIKKNCYSNTVEAALLSPKHIGTFSTFSEFRYIINKTGLQFLYPKNELQIEFIKKNQ